MDELKDLKNELNDINNEYFDKRREYKSWDYKMKLLVQIKTEMKKKVGDSGDIEVIKLETHRMQVKITFFFSFLIINVFN